MSTFLVRYFIGAANGLCLIFADDEASARATFLEHHPRLRDYNIQSVKQTKSRWFELARQ